VSLCSSAVAGIVLKFCKNEHRVLIKFFLQKVYFKIQVFLLLVALQYVSNNEYILFLKHIFNTRFR